MTKYYYNKTFIHTINPFTGGDYYYYKYSIYKRRLFWFPKLIKKVYNESDARRCCDRLNQNKN